MSKLIDRTVLGALAFLFSVAIADVSIARAQTSSGPSIIPTGCGAGVLDACSTVNTYHCEWKFVFNLAMYPWSGGFGFEEVCTVSGTKPIYKDRLGAIPTTTTCSVPPKPLGPPGDDEVQVEQPFEGDGTCDG